MIDRERTLERPRKANPVALEKILVPLADSIGLSSDVRFDKLKRNWLAIVGDVNARNTKPTDLRNGILTVSVSSPVWITQARFYTSTFIKKINAFDAGDGVEVREIRFVLDRS